MCTFQLNEKNVELQEARCQDGQNVMQPESGSDISTNILRQVIISILASPF